MALIEGRREPSLTESGSPSHLMPMSLLRFPLLLLVLLGPTPLSGTVQTEGIQTRTARISEEVRSLRTYPFSEPNPVPILIRDPRLYPYHSFDGYSATAEKREWKVVRLENDYIEVFVLPEAGGKVWGAVVKETGHEFIYRNEVMKFRNIALRGPWTSGGIEFNFGVIGHTPATATPVDYVIRENPDGSVSCWVGGMDLPSRTHWRVEIRLRPDRAYFETNVLWYNPTPLEQPYYNWMTAAAFAQDDLEMSIPGDGYLEHSGNKMSWPVDEQGRYLQLYGNNTFESHKSYHAVGELNDFFGGYYHDDGYGFGHWARYEDMPGQKLWLWALSREGGIWEDLLTDTDGQYVEFQAGRLFVQFSPGPEVNPITQASFDPLSASRWTETWFPVEQIGGLTDASRDGAMHVSLEDRRLTVGVNAFRNIVDTLRVWSGDRLVTSIPVDLEVLKPFQTMVEVTPGDSYRVQLGLLELDYSSNPSDRMLARPFTTDLEAFSSIPELDRKVFQAREFLKGRQYLEARDLFQAALDIEPWNRDALLGLAELSHRGGLWVDGLEYVNRALQLDAYDAKANFLAGVLYRALERTADAHDAFGWAARSTAYRTAAYSQLAELMIVGGAFTEAARYARLALDFDGNGVPAWRTLAVIGRKTGDDALAQEAIHKLLDLDPLHHFALAEIYLTSPSEEATESLVSSLRGEYPDQSLLEIAIGYVSLGLPGAARLILAINVEEGQTPGIAVADPQGAQRRQNLIGLGPVHRAWVAWLGNDPSSLGAGGDPAFQFPFRPETIPVLEWAMLNDGAWVWEYLLALNLWAVDRREEALSHLEALSSEPDFGPFYVARAHLAAQLRGVDPTADLRRGIVSNPDSWALHIQLVRHLQEQERWMDALTALDVARARFPADFNLGLFEARALINVGRALQATEIFDDIQVLPSENASEAHLLYQQAHTSVALDAIDAAEFSLAKKHLLSALKWPESLGQGRPYDPEERLVRLLLAQAEYQLGNPEEARAAFQAVVDATNDPGVWGNLSALNEPDRFPSRLDLLALPALRALGATPASSLPSWASGEPGGVARRLGTDLPGLFSDLEGRMILRALGQG